MKELTVEEKAKRYDEAIDKVAYFIKKHIGFGSTIHPNSSEAKELFNIFPELKESEDERIRKVLVGFFKSYKEEGTVGSETFNRIPTDNIIAWLKKQGEQESIWHNEEEEPKKGSLILLIMQNETPIVAKIIESNHTFNHGERWAYIDDLLEKQGEKSADKVESKFHVNEWVVTGTNDIVQIKAVNNDHYTIDSGMEFNMSYIDRYWHKWTIEDAKPGDVLFHSDSASNGIFIFKELLKYEFGEKVICYCDYDSEDHFCLGENHTCCWTDAKILHPATKEQRELLFQKMKEAGFKWDDDKKELKKIEQKPYGQREECLDCQFNYVGECKGFCNMKKDKQKSQRMISAEAKEALFDYENANIQHNDFAPKTEPKFRVGDSIKTANEEPLTITEITDSGYWSEDLFICNFDDADKWELVKQNPAWSEEDEKIINDLLWIIEAYRENGFNEIHRCMADKSENWLKSLKPQNIWKPSDEQMQVLLSEVTAWTKGCAKQIVLESLYNDLNKLRKE